MILLASFPGSSVICNLTFFHFIYCAASGARGQGWVALGDKGR